MSIRIKPLHVTLAAIGLAMAAMAGCKKTAPQEDAVRPVRAMRIGDVSMIDNKGLPGRAQATQEVNLSFRVAGPLVARPVDVGDVVETGSVLAQIDKRDFEVDLRNVQAQLADAQAALVLAADQFDRAQTAYDRGAVSEIELSRERAKRDRAQAQVESLEAQVESSEDELSYTTLKAPFDGVVVAIYVENFEDVVAKQAILRLLDHSRIEMIVDVPEQGIVNSAYVKDIRVTFDALPGVELDAEIKEIGREASESTRTYPVTLIMDQPEGVTILPGMTGEARARVEPPDQDYEPGYEVPLSAVASADGETSYVWVIAEPAMTVAQRAVDLGPMGDVGIKVTGVQPGEWIATAGVHYLHEGQQVRILDETRDEAEVTQ